jgi:hypothetical protein
MINTRRAKHVGRSIRIWTMVRFILFGFCWFFSLNGFAAAVGRPKDSPQQAAVLQSQIDTLTIEHDIAHQPFLLDTISLEAIKSLFGQGWVIQKRPVRNRFVKNQTDTLITIKKDKSYICLYAVSKADKNFYQSARIQDPLPIFQNDLHIGQSKKEIQALFPELKAVAGIPDFIKFEAGEAGDYLYLFFEKGILKKVEFKPYLD